MSLKCRAILTLYITEKKKDNILASTCLIIVYNNNIMLTKIKVHNLAKGQEGWHNKMLLLAKLNDCQIATHKNNRFIFFPYVHLISSDLWVAPAEVFPELWQWQQSELFDSFPTQESKPFSWLNCIFFLKNRSCGGLYSIASNSCRIFFIVEFRRRKQLT